MVLQVVYAAVSAVLPSGYYVHIGFATAVLIVLYAFAQGRSTTRERDLHGRVFIVTGAFTPLGLTLLTALASRGAHIIGISDYPLDHPYPSLLVPVLRTTTNNENIWAEHADLSDPTSIREFCTRFLTGQDQRLDGIVFGHEYRSIGLLFGGKRSTVAFEEEQENASLATFLMITLLLPALLVEPAERDIRIVNVVNPLYAASVPAFASSLISPTPFAESARTSPLLLSEGSRALRTVVLTRHLQRVLDSLPNRAPAGPSAMQPDQKRESKQEDRFHPSNITSVSVCPGVSRKDTVAPLLGAERDSVAGWSMLGFTIYTLLFPFLLLLTKSPNSTIQSVLHVLFLPTPMKRALAQVDAAANPTATAPQPDPDSDKDGERKVLPSQVVLEEVLKPGALYRECAVVTMDIPPLPPAFSAGDGKQGEKAKDAKTSAKRKGKEEEREDMSFPDDGELGGEAVGRVVWEWYEAKLKKWEADAKEKHGPAEKVAGKVDREDEEKPK